MALLSVQNLTFTHGVKTLFSAVSFGIQSGEKVAVVGVNGCGKSTLLRLVADTARERNPAIVTQTGLRIGYLAQHPVFDPNDTVLDHVFRGDTVTTQAIRRYHQCLAMADASADMLADAMSAMDACNAWEYETWVASVLKELEITSLTQKMESLSGGEVRKVSLAKVLFESSDLLVLDEPTNHFDVDMIVWLENTLKTLAVSLLVVTHDRYFLDSVCTRIVEIDQQKLWDYPGDYQAYLSLKSAQRVRDQVLDTRAQALLRRELDWLKQGPKARSTKQKARIDRIDDLKRTAKAQTEQALQLDMGERRLGKKILELKSVSKTFGQRCVLDRFSYSFKEGERVGIVGGNGVGKSTLLQMIAGRLLPDGGEIEAGINTVFGVFDQHTSSALFDMHKTVYDTMRVYGEHVIVRDGTSMSMGKLLERFLFPNALLNTPVGQLSGGEKRRLHLVTLLLQSPNFLLFDEPTNDLDTLTLAVLEEFLLAFKGCVLLVSHDRYFMDRIADRLFVLESGGKMIPFLGSFSDYLVQKTQRQTHKKTTGVVASTVASVEIGAVIPGKLSYKERQELDRLVRDIDDLETEKKQLLLAFSDVGLSAEGYAKTGRRMAEVTQLLDEKLVRWEMLASREVTGH